MGHVIEMVRCKSSSEDEIYCKKDGTGSCLQVCGRGPEMEGKGEFEVLGVLRGLGSWGGGLREGVAN